jgi:hypothetical protein
MNFYPVVLEHFHPVMSTLAVLSTLVQGSVNGGKSIANSQRAIMHVSAESALAYVPLTRCTATEGYNCRLYCCKGRILCVCGGGGGVCMCLGSKTLIGVIRHTHS